MQIIYFELCVASFTLALLGFQSFKDAIKKLVNRGMARVRGKILDHAKKIAKARRVTKSDIPKLKSLVEEMRKAREPNATFINFILWLTFAGFSSFIAFSFSATNMDSLIAVADYLAAIGGFAFFMGILYLARIFNVIFRGTDHL